jgi:hypothetical protein
MLKFEDAKGIIRQRRTDITMAKRKKRKNLQNFTQKTKYRETRIPLKPGGELRCSRS